jgi:hypothetical protein
MKGKGGPGRGLNAVVMHFVDPSEYAREMHPPVEPVIIRFMHEHIDGQAYGKIPEGVSEKIGIQYSISFLP